MSAPGKRRAIRSPTPAERASERQLMEAVLHLARLRRWEVYHTHDSRRSPPGYPDLCLCRPPRLLFWECKVGRNQLTPDQARWLGLLGAIPGVECAVIREADWQEGRVERWLQ